MTKYIYHIYVVGIFLKYKNIYLIFSSKIYIFYVLLYLYLYNMKKCPQGVICIENMSMFLLIIFIGIFFIFYIFL